MQILESEVENKVAKRALEEMGVPSIKLNIRGNTGWPDRCFFIPGGKPLLVEFKRPGEDARPRQNYIHNVLVILGYDIEVHDDEIRALQSIARALGAAQLREEGSEVPIGAQGGRSVPGSRVGQDVYNFSSFKVPIKK